MKRKEENNKVSEINSRDKEKRGKKELEASRKENDQEGR